MTQETKEPVFEVRPLRKRRTIEQREADAQKELQQLQELKKVQTRSKIQHAIETLNTIHPSFLTTPPYQQNVKSLEALLASVK